VGGGKAAPPLGVSLNRQDKYLQVTSHTNLSLMVCKMYDLGSQFTV